MHEMVLKVKRLTESAKLPTKDRQSDAGWDLYANSITHRTFNIDDEEVGQFYVVNTGIAIQIPRGYCGLIFDRSSMGAKGYHRLAGVIDEEYRGEIIILLNRLPYHKDGWFSPKDDIKAGDKVAQLLLVEVPQHVLVQEVDELDKSDRGTKGFGSSGV